MPEKNQCFTAQITGLTSEGSGVCRIDGMAVFVPGTAVGDTVNVKIVKLLKSYGFGIATGIISPSPDRISNDCPVYKQCGGCVFRHINYEAECRAKMDMVRDAFERIGGLSPVYDAFIGSESLSRYRNKAQFPLAVQDGKAVCGFYAQRSHRVVPIKDCPLQPQIFSEIVREVLVYINEKKISVYDEQTGTGMLRHIYLRKGAHSGEIMLCIVARKDVSRQLSGLTRRISEKFPDIRSIVLNINPDKTNVILGKTCKTLWGDDFITDVMCGNTVRISPLSFYQVNTVQAERLYARALEYAAPDKNSIVADLYCGAGTIGLSMAKSAKQIVGVEIIPEAVDNAKENAELNSADNAEFYCGDAGEVFRRLRSSGCKPDIIIIDPPRKGCSEDTLREIVEAAPEKVVMISCNPATAARDAKWLSENGYRTERVSGADLFSRTRHVECVVLMSSGK